MRQTTEATLGIVRAANSLAQFGLSARRARGWEFQNAASYSCSNTIVRAVQRTPLTRRMQHSTATAGGRRPTAFYLRSLWERITTHWPQCLTLMSKMDF